MDFVEQVKDRCRNDWFKDHVAEIKGEEGLQVIHWGAPGSIFYYTKFVLSGSNIFISGDLGEAVYTLTCKATLKNIKSFDIHYFSKKLSAFCDERWDFDCQLAQRELDEFWKEHNMDNWKDGQKIYDGISEAIRESSSMEAYRAWLLPVYQGTSIDSDTMDYIWNFGKRMPRRLIGYWVGLQMAIEKLENTKQT